MNRRPALGLLVAIEGIDGAGKSTLERHLARSLRREGFSVRLWKEPADPGLGRRAQLAGPRRPWTAAMFFTLDRALARSRLERLLRRSDVVLADRSFYSTLAYQGSALSPRERRPLATIQRSASIEPDRVLWLRLSPREALARVERRGHVRAPLERRRTLERVARAYARLARAPRWTTLDANALPPRLVEAAREALRLPRPPHGPRGRRIRG